jgi:hypothetical protein
MALDVLQLLASMEQLLFALLVLSSSPVTFAKLKWRCLNLGREYDFVAFS